MIVLLLVVLVSPRASAQCRTACARGEGRDPYGCCVPVRERVARRAPAPPRPESLVGDDVSVLAGDAATEAYHWARAWLARARALRGATAAMYFRRAAGAALVVLSIEPTGPRAGRMRAVLVQSLDGAGMIEAGECEAAALGGPRPSDEPEELRTLRADTLLNLAWAHQTIAQRLERSRDGERRERAASRFRRAADYYQLYVAAFPELPAAPSARNELATALLGAGDPVGAGAVLEQLARAVPARRAEALARAVDAYQRALEAGVQAGTVALRVEPPPPSQRPPWDAPLPFPPQLQRVVDARDRWLEATAPETVRQEVRRQQALENALWSYRYGRWDDASERMRALLIERCDDRSARVAFEILALMDPPPDGAVADVCALTRGR